MNIKTDDDTESAVAEAKVACPSNYMIALDTRFVNELSSQEFMTNQSFAEQWEDGKFTNWRSDIGVEQIYYYFFDIYPVVMVG
eukprot:UN21863